MICKTNFVRRGLIRLHSMNMSMAWLRAGMPKEPLVTWTCQLLRISGEQAQ